MIYDTLNPRILDFVLQDAKEGVRVLDVGCGTGRLGQLLKSKIKCSITGIEIDELAVAQAKQWYDEIILIDLEDLISRRCLIKLEEKYDFIVFGDILEHVTQPSELLKCFDRLLAKNGFLIASIPNIANWMIRIRLIFGNFDCSGGILDPGHLRFFTYKTAKALLENSGYKIIAVVNNNETFLIRTLGRLWKRLFAFQFVFKCIKNTSKGNNENIQEIVR